MNPDEPGPVPMGDDAAVPGPLDDTPDGIPRPTPAEVAAATAATAGRRGRGRRVSRWDRPKHPKDWRFWVGGTGRVLMVVGILMFGFVAYQLWGTAIEYRQHQNALERQFDRRVAELAATSVAPTTAPATTAATPTTPPATPTRPSSTPTRPSSTPTAPTDSSSPTNALPTTTLPTTTLPTTTLPPTTTAPAVAPWPDIDLGDVIAYFEIPRLGKTVYAVAGIRTADLKQGLGHYPDTPLPGQLGNSAFAGHRTTYGAPLYSIDEMRAGDEIVVNTLTGVRYVYRMVGEARIVSPSTYSVITDSDPGKATLTITSCHPRYSAKQRIVIRAELDTSVSTPSGPPTPLYVDPDEIPPDETDQEPESTVVGPDGEPTETGTDSGGIVVNVDTQDFDGAEGLSRGWFSDSGAWPQVVLWAAAITAIAVLAYLLDRRLRRYWPGLVLATVPFLVALYFLYQNINRLLPPDL